MDALFTTPIGEYDSSERSELYWLKDITKLNDWEIDTEIASDQFVSFVRKNDGKFRNLNRLQFAQLLGALKIANPEKTVQIIEHGICDKKAYILVFIE